MKAIKSGQNKWYRTKNQELAIKAEAVTISRKGAYVPLLAVLGLSTVLGQPIYSHYPEVQYLLRPLFNQVIPPLNLRSPDALHILWSKFGKLDTRKGTMFIPDHFVPIVEKSEDVK